MEMQKNNFLLTKEWTVLYAMNVFHSNPFLKNVDISEKLIFKKSNSFSVFLENR